MTETKRQAVGEIPPRCPAPFCASRDDAAPLFTAEGYMNGEVKLYNLADYTDRWVILLFYASDFTFV